MTRGDGVQFVGRLGGEPIKKATLAAVRASELLNLGPGGGMSLLKRLFGGKPEPPKQRIRVCIECGMPLAEHRDWCAILRHQMEREAARPSSQ